MARLFYMSLPGVGDWSAAMRESGAQLAPYRSYLVTAKTAADNRALSLAWRSPSSEESRELDRRLRERAAHASRRSEDAQRRRDRRGPREVPSGTWIVLEPRPGHAEEPETTFDAFLGAKDVHERPPVARGSAMRWVDEAKIDVAAFDREALALLLSRQPTEIPPPATDDADANERGGSDGPLLFLRPNTWPLECQRRTLEAMEDRPAPRLAPLLRLVSTRPSWGRVEHADVAEDAWVFLRRAEDASLRDGTTEQREFVRRALGTPDFALLEGPPGSGKTTAICELIVQLTRAHKRVLLVASTHVAVDNVLERLMEWQDDADEKLVMPIRIGDDDNVTSGAVSAWTLRNLLLADDRLAAAMLRAAQRGVRVYVLTSSEQRIGKVVREDEVFERGMAEHHKKLLESLAGKVLLRSAAHVHAKFLVVDPGDREARAWLSTANFNKALENSLELGVKLDAVGARALAACFQWAFWAEAERELRGPHRLIEIRANHPAAPSRPADGTVHATLRDGTALREQLLVLIGDARREILAASYGIDADHVTVRALIEAAQRGVRVTVLTRPRSAVAAGVAALAAAGVSVVGHDKLHAKALVVDGRALVMSANLEAMGLDSGFEVGAILPTDTALGVEKTLRDWASTFPWVYRADATRAEHVGDFCPAGAGLRDGVVNVTEAHAQTAPAVVAHDALALDAAPAPELKPSPAAGTVPRRVTFTWDVQPPRLPQGATERMRDVQREEGDQQSAHKTKGRVPHDPPVFEHGGRVYVVLTRAEDCDRVRHVAADLGATVVVR